MVAQSVIKGESNWSSDLPFVVSHVKGSAGAHTWNYRTWSNGFIEIFGRFIAQNTSDASNAYTQRIDFPIQFTDPDSIVIRAGLITPAIKFQIEAGTPANTRSYFRCHLTQKNDGSVVTAALDAAAQYYAAGF